MVSYKVIFTNKNGKQNSAIIKGKRNLMRTIENPDLRGSSFEIVTSKPKTNKKPNKWIEFIKQNKSKGKMNFRDLREKYMKSANSVSEYDTPKSGSKQRKVTKKKLIEKTTDDLSENDGIDDTTYEETTENTE